VIQIDANIKHKTYDNTILLFPMLFGNAVGHRCFITYKTK